MGCHERARDSQTVERVGEEEIVELTVILGISRIRLCRNRCHLARSGDALHGRPAGPRLYIPVFPSLTAR